MLYDVFSFFNELDILDERLSYLYDYVDYFVICESNTTHVGKVKPLYFSDNFQRFQKFNNKIIHLIYDGRQEIDNPWINENLQRNYILNNLNLNSNDKIIISDVDEIPSIHFIERLRSYNGSDLLIAIQELSYFWPNYRRSDLPYWIGGSRGFNYKHLLNLRFLNSNYSQTFLKSYNQGVTLTQIRLSNIGIPITLGGWHLSYMGGRDSIRNKILSFAHSEEKIRIGDKIHEHIDNFINSGKNFFGKNELYISQGSFNSIILKQDIITTSKYTFIISARWFFIKMFLIFKIKIKYYVNLLLQ